MPSCAYHPDRTPIDRCRECGRDICSECRTEVAGKPACGACVQSIRARIAAEMASEPTSVQPHPQEAYAAQPSDESAPPLTYPAPSPIVQDTAGPGRLLAGIALGVLFGGIGAYIIKLVAYYAHLEVAYLNILVGSAAGFGVVLGSGRHGILPGIFGGLLALGSMVFSDYLVIQQQYQDVVGLPDPISFDIFLQVWKAQDPFHWFFVAVGVYAGFTIAAKRKPRFNA